jgi:hypothetical protein
VFRQKANDELHCRMELSAGGNEKISSIPFGGLVFTPKTSGDRKNVKGDKSHCRATTEEWTKSEWDVR